LHKEARRVHDPDPSRSSVTTRRRRGRPRRANAKRRQTTLAGRRPELDLGTSELRARKVQATTRGDLEINPAAALFGHGAIDAQQFETLGLLGLWLRTLARAWGGEMSVTGLWSAITGGLIPVDWIGRNTDLAASLGVGARKQLARAVARLDGSRALVIGIIEGPTPPVVFRVIEGQTTRSAQVELERLRTSLDHLDGRRTQHGRDSSR
jgi:hypothetical protein